jgi:hypothetical protein
VLVSVNTAGSEIISINTGSPGCFLLPLGLDTFTFFGLLGVPTVVFENLSAFGVILSVTATAVAVAVGVAVAVAERARTHLSLDKDCPDPRRIMPRRIGKVIAIPQVGGLHHRYERLAA